ncbi:citramalate synthase [Candidatus Woesearchaeota archaeon]|nr:citramalate synthase [Candidatus Woesearchaeota archaeon]
MKIYDTTLRDGAQDKDVDFTVKEKLEILKLLDRARVDYAELGWPGSNQMDMDTFLEAYKMSLQHTRISAFGSTRKKDLKAEEDPNLIAIVESKARVSSIFGKTWLQHVKAQLKMTPEENLEAIYDSVKFLKKNLDEVFFDAEHFFDGFKDNKDYATKVVQAAFNAGADAVIMCDTNGGCLPMEVDRIFSEIRGRFPDEHFGIHCHNDTGCATANSLMCAHDLVQIQGTINGIGERTGNADLCEIIPGLELKMGISTAFRLDQLKHVSDMVYLLANIDKDSSKPYLGKKAFAHKGGVHVDAINKGAIYEHIDPSLVGNNRDIVLSELSGAANIVEMLKEFDVEAEKKDPRVQAILKDMKSMRKQGYQVGDLKAEKYLLMNRYFNNDFSPFEVNRDTWKVMTGRRKGKEFAECTLTGIVDGKDYDVYVPVDDNGPVDAIYQGLKKLISHRYQEINDVRLENFKVKIAEDKGVESSVMVYIQFKNHEEDFATSGVSTNIIEASMEAVLKGFRYYLLRHVV